jgi:transcriptional regulator with XRE-family HTH domain
MRFGDKLRALREQRHLSQNELGALAGLHGRHIGRFEIGGSLPGAGSVVAVARALGVSTDYLLRDELEEPEIGMMTISEELLRRVRQIEALPEEDRRTVFAVIGAFAERQEGRRPGERGQGR